jgi:hypothetical protein
LAVVCPGRERHCRSQGADEAERYCHAHAAASSTGAARRAAQGRASGGATSPAARGTAPAPRTRRSTSLGAASGVRPGKSVNQRGMRCGGIAAWEMIRTGPAARACGACRGVRRRFPDCIPLNTAAVRDGYPVSLSRVGRKTTSVIGTITRRADPEAGLPVLILKIPNNPILQSRTRPDCNCGATQTRTRECAYTITVAFKTAVLAFRRGLDHGVPEFLSIDFAFWRGRWRRPCVKYRF